MLLGGYAPIAACNALLRKLVAADDDLNNVHGRHVELTFAPGGETSARLSITGRMEPKTLDVKPFQFPLPNQGRVLSPSSAAYTYRLGAQQGRLTLNGELDEEHLPEKPLFAERVSPASGHPEGTVYGWARDDTKTLYLALDVTPDNTYDADKDYAVTHVQMNGAGQDFKVDVSNRAWDRAGFTYTRKARYEHKVYEFALPLAQLALEGAPKGTPVKLAFTVYGTAGLGK